MTRLTSRVAALVMGAFASFPLAPALADCHANGVDSGDDYFAEGSPYSSQVAQWRLGQHKLSEDVYASSGLLTSRCQDVYLDWATTSGHYDGRLTRVCDPDSSRLTDQDGDGWSQEPSDWAGRTVTGLQKGAACVFDQSNVDFVSCTQSAEHLSGCTYDDDDAFTLSQMVNFQRYWVRFQNGTIDYNNAGDPANPNG